MIVLVIDVQKALVDEDLYAFDAFVDGAVRLVKAARKKTAFDNDYMTGETIVR